MRFPRIFVLAGTLLAVSACVAGPYDGGQYGHGGGGRQRNYGANQQQYYGSGPAPYYPAQYYSAPYYPAPYYPAQYYRANQPRYHGGGQGYSYSGGQGQ